MAENYFRLTSLEDGNSIALTQNGTPNAINLQYRTDISQEWQNYAIGTQIELANGAWVEFRNDT